ncbi:thioredoxin family protein [Shewanella sp. MBTL60-007]|uniref:thioredoxin family protein n=1 Tax=Shewanella sp. MBTL60-007 TaxID=2815911 RepID=UPI001BBD36F9|nr:thioredoxin family protein [Shewanella sp. MBTL60-007]GIU30880.1 redox-active disulfide protein 2 [Shewanella sp. MBTL60-007]
MKIEILGSGCKKCTNLATEVERIATEMALPFTLNKVTDMAVILDYGVMSTPAIVVNGDVVIAGKVPSEQEIQDLLSTHR